MLAASCGLTLPCATDPHLACALLLRCAPTHPARLRVRREVGATILHKRAEVFWLLDGPGRFHRGTVAEFKPDKAVHVIQ